MTATGVRTLLVIDDNEDDQRLYQRAFRGRDEFVLIPVMNAEAGLHAIAERAPDLILLDYNLPGMDGMAFLARFAGGAPPPIPVIMLTGEGNETLAAQALKEGAADYLVKHVDGRHLRLLPLVVEQVIRERDNRAAMAKAESDLIRQRELTDAILDTTAALILVLDRAGRVVRFNRQCERTSGYRADEVMGKDLLSLLTPEEERDTVEHVFASLIRGDPLTRHQNRWRPRVGAPRMIRWDYTVLKNPDGELEFIVATGVDVTEAMAAEYKLQLAANVFYNIIEGVLVTAPDGTILSVNPACCALTGYSAEELIGRNPRQMKSDQHPAAFYSDMWRDICSNGSWTGEIWNRRKGGETFLCRQTITAIRDEYGVVQNYISVFSDITEMKQREECIRHQAYHDVLTDLPNRSLFMDRLGQALNKSRRDRQPMALMFIDLDHFKAVNDDFGHGVGDRLLVEAARRIVESVRDVDTVARLGGDEFTVILSDLAHHRDVLPLAERIRAHLSQPMSLMGHDIQVSACIGIAFHPDDADTSDELIKKADQAMYQVKQAGGNGYRLAADDGPPPAPGHR